MEQEGHQSNSLKTKVTQPLLKMDWKILPAINNIVLKPGTVIIENPTPFTIVNSEISVQLELDGFAAPGWKIIYSQWFFIQVYFLAVLHKFPFCKVFIDVSYFLLLLKCSGIDGDNFLFC